MDCAGVVGLQADAANAHDSICRICQTAGDWLQGMPILTVKMVQAIAQQLGRSGTDGLEDRRLFQVPEIVRAGGLNALKRIDTPVKVLQETKIRLFCT
ncbi:MAG: hypothetical protein HC895_03070 [Leptolyngbyaceae cyanobacterium SM1_3_5]|nr:hypothetical protein [Leptolyngbyaceae cyanobacterium SM1_3_5]